MLADRADWFEIRRKMIEPVVGDFARSKQIKVETFGLISLPQERSGFCEIMVVKPTLL